MPKKVLLIVYQFCPKGQIGTRRWSKFAKYLSRNGYEVHVICAKYPYRDKINWCHEVENNPNIIIHRIGPVYPTFLLKPKRDFWVKLFDRIFSRTIFYLDASQHWGTQLIPTAQTLIKKENIQTVIASGGPFMALYHAAKLKNSLPNIRLILDFRDPWSTWLPNRTRFEKWRKKQAEKLEQIMVPQADLSLFTTKQLREQYSEMFPREKERFAVLYNGFDEDDFKDLEVGKPIQPLHFVYAGSLIKERVEAIVAIVTALVELNDSLLYQKLRIKLYGFDYQKPSLGSQALMEAYDHYVSHNGVVSQKEVFRILSENDICLSINAKGHEYLIGAKTFDYMGLQKKIFLLSLPGELSDILQKRGQYVADYDQESIKQALLKVKTDYASQQQEQLADYNPFNYHGLTDQLIHHIEEK